MEDRIGNLLSFLKEIEKCKTIERRTYTSNANRKESDADHSWHLAMFLLAFQNDLPKMDFQKALKMALIHDLVEVYAGDTFTFDEEGRKTQKEREAKAAKKLFAHLPPDIEKEFSGLFSEFEEEKTKEAKVVKSFDKIQPLLQNICSDGKGWLENGIKYKDVVDHKRDHMLHDDTILKIFDMLLEEAKKKNYI